MTHSRSWCEAFSSSWPEQREGIPDPKGSAANPRPAPSWDVADWEGFRKTRITAGEGLISREKMEITARGAVRRADTTPGEVSGVPQLGITQGWHPKPGVFPQEKAGFSFLKQTGLGETDSQLKSQPIYRTRIKTLF